MKLNQLLTKLLFVFVISMLFVPGITFAQTNGCTDETACNYDPDATEDDGSCEYAQENYDCDNNCLESELENCCLAGDDFACMELEMSCMQGDSDACDVLCEVEHYGYYELGSCGCGTAYSFNASSSGEVSACDGSTSAGIGSGSGGGSFDYGTLTEIFFFVPSGGNSTYELTAYSAETGKVIFGSGTANTVNIYYTGSEPNIEKIVESGSGHVINLIFAQTNGCTDETACNYDPDATEDDGSCEYAQENYDCDNNCLESELENCCLAGDDFACMELEMSCMQGDSDACDVLCEVEHYGYYELGSCGCGTAYSFNASSSGEVSACDGSTSAGIGSGSGGGSFDYGTLTEIFFFVPSGGNSTYELTAYSAETGIVVFGSGSNNTVNIYFAGDEPTIETVVESGSGHSVNLIFVE